MWVPKAMAGAAGTFRTEELTAPRMKVIFVLWVGRGRIWELSPT